MLPSQWGTASTRRLNTQQNVFHDKTTSQKLPVSIAVQQKIDFSKIKTQKSFANFF
jgi:hypothetical protein